MYDCIIEKYDSAGHLIYEQEIEGYIEAENTDEIISMLNITDDNRYAVVIRNKNGHAMLYHNINIDVGFELIFSDGTEEKISTQVSYSNNNEFTRLYDSLATIKGWCLSSDVVQSIRGGDNNIKTQIRRQIGTLGGLKEIRYCIPHNSPTYNIFHP